MQYKYAIQVCVFLAVVFLSTGLYIYFTTRKAVIKSFLEDQFADPLQEKTIRKRYLELVNKFFGGKAKITKLDEWILKADIEKVKAEEILGISMALGVTLGVLIFLAVLPDYAAGILFGLTFGLLGYMTPETIIRGKARTRNRKANMEALGYVELLSTAISAGLTPNQSMKKICQYSEGVLAAEFEQALGEMSGGQTKKTALEGIMGRLSEAQNVVLLIEAIIQADESGQPMGKVLSEQAESIGSKIENNATEAAQKANTKLLAPIILFILLPMMYLIVGPAIMQLGKVLSF